MSIGMTAATTLGGAITGMMVGDALGAVPTKTAIPATSNSAKAKSTADGKPVSSEPTPRQVNYMSAGIVVGCMAVLLFGSKFLKDARIG